VAAPVRDAHGDVVASVSVSGPSFRFDEDRIAEIVPLVCTATTEISGLLAHVPPES
jgi:IclR family acetate operon transcriptional repressor